MANYAKRRPPNGGPLSRVISDSSARVALICCPAFGKYLQAARAMESLTWIYCRRSFGTSIGRAHAPIITCLAESNPLRPTQYIRLERRLRCNRGLARPLPIIGIGLTIMIASATIPQCFCEYQPDFLDRHSQRLFCCVAAAVFA